MYTVGCLQELLRTFVVPYGKSVTVLLDSTKRDSLEHGYKLQSDGTKIYGKGTKENLSYRHNPGQTYIERFHTHPPDSTQFCGGADIWSIFWMLHKNQIRDEDIPIFKYGIIPMPVQIFNLKI